MRLFFDTCYLYRVYANEPGAEQVRELLHDCETLCSGCHARAEFASILFRKRRENSLSLQQTMEKQEQFLKELSEGHLVLFPFEEPVFRLIETVMNRAAADTFLRAADALHLSVAAVNGFEAVYSNDRHFLASAPLFGLKPVNVIEG